LKATNIGITSG